MIEVETNNDQQLLPIDQGRLCKAIIAVLRGESVISGAVSLAVVDGPTIHKLNRRWLNHDYPTDVLSFLIERTGDHLEGEIVVSAEMALETAVRYNWAAGDELLLYVIHGALHLVGYGDNTDKAQATMRSRERHYMGQFGLEPPYDDVVGSG
jgi:probable rRNA maturation factor